MASGRGQEEVVLRQFRRLFGAGGAAGLTEGQLLGRFAADGDSSAFEALVDRHGPMVLGVCRRMLRDPNDADDAFQATFLVLVRRAGAIRDGERLAPWLHGVALRVASRARSRASKLHDRERPCDVEATAPVSDPSAWEIRELLDEELGRLPEKYRSPIVLCYLEGQSHEEAARRLRWPIGTVKGRLARARELLRSRLARRGVVASATTLFACLPRQSSAAIPETLLESTARAASRYWATNATAGAVSASTILAQGVLKTMFWNQAKAVAAAALLSIGVVSVGAGLLGQGGAKAQALAEGEPVTVVEKATLRGDAAKILGSWTLVQTETNGQVEQLPGMESRSALFTADACIKLVGAGRSWSLEATPYKLDPSSDPKAIDLTVPSGPSKGKNYPAIYRLDDNALILGFAGPGQPRPTDFTPAKGSIRVMSYVKSTKDAMADEGRVIILPRVPPLPNASLPPITGVLPDPGAPTDPVAVPNAPTAGLPSDNEPRPPAVPRPSAPGTTDEERPSSRKTRSPKAENTDPFLAPTGPDEEPPRAESRGNSPRELSIQFRKAEMEYLRKKLLFERGAIPKRDCDQAKADLDLCKARLELRAEDLRDELEILEAQLLAKRARVKKAEAIREGAFANVARIRAMRDKGTNFASNAEIAQAESDRASADADRDVHMAEVFEQQLRIKRVKRLLAEFEKLAVPTPE